MKNKKMKVAVCLGIMVALLAMIMSSWANQRVRSSLPEYMKQTIEENHRIGSLKSKIIVEKNQSIALYYPHFSKKQIDQQIEDAIQEELEKFSKENEGVSGECTLYSDYESYDLNERFGSVILSFQRQGAFNHKEVRAWMFDLKEDKVMTLHDLFSAQSLSHLAFLTQSFLSGIIQSDQSESYEVTPETLQQEETNFMLNSEELRVFFNAKTLAEKQVEEMEARIPIQKVINYINEEVLSSLGLQRQKHVVDPNKPMVCLTYDDGPSRLATPRILDALQKVNGAATFFVLGSRVAGHADIVARVLDEGSEMGNHTFGHKDLTKIKEQEMLDQFDATWQAISEVGSLDNQGKLVRPTYGAFNDYVKKTAPYPLIMWSIDTRDWSHQNVARTVQAIKDKVEDGDIILMHDLYEETAQASEEIIAWLDQEGYQLVTVSEMYEAKKIELVPGQIYYNTAVHKWK